MTTSNRLKYVDFKEIKTVENEYDLNVKFLKIQKFIIFL